MPSSTPDGIFTVSVRRVRTRPSPPQVAHGCGMTVPKPWQAGHGRDETTWPRNVRCTDWTSPRPPQMSQVVGWVPGAVPAPEQVVHDDRGVDGDRRLDAERGLVQVELEPQDRVGAGPDARARPTAGGAAEERVHDVLEADERAAAAGPATAAAGRERVAAEVDDLPLLRVGQHLVGGVDLLEPLLRLRDPG